MCSKQPVSLPSTLQPSLKGTYCAAIPVFQAPSPPAPPFFKSYRLWFFKSFYPAGFFPFTHTQKKTPQTHKINVNWRSLVEIRMSQRNLLWNSSLRWYGANTEEAGWQSSSQEAQFSRLWHWHASPPWPRVPCDYLLYTKTVAMFITIAFS